MPINLTCPVCQSPFTRKPAEIRATNCCSRRCSTTLNYKLHGVNKGKNRSPSTQFASGVRPVNALPIGSVTIRTRHKRHGDKRAWVKVAEPNVWRERAVVVWESINGPRRSGYVIHHVNGDSIDDRPENLVALTRAEHASVHATTSPNMSS